MNSNEKTTIQTTENFIFIPIIITFTSFEHLSGQSQKLKKVLKSWEQIENIPLIMSIFELESVCGLLDKQYLFIDYILQRYHAINTPNNPFFSQIGTDELVQLGHYIKTSYIPFLTLRLEKKIHGLMFDSSWQNEIDYYFEEIIVPEEMACILKEKL